MADQRITASYSSRYTFTGKEQDAFTGLHYFGARYYDARISLWYGVDPMAEERSSFTPYNYCSNNPIIRIDPSGALDGDYYNFDGTYLGSDGKNDNLVYVVNSIDPTTASNGLSSSELLNIRDGNHLGSTDLVATLLPVNHSTFEKLAGVSYGESSTQNLMEEMYGIASATVNYNNAKGKNANLSNTINQIANAASDGNERFTAYSEVGAKNRNSSSGMKIANAAAINALTGGHDYSNGATGWDGNDLPNNSHRFGLNISNPAHDIYKVGDRPLINQENGSLYRR